MSSGKRIFHITFTTSIDEHPDTVIMSNLGLPLVVTEVQSSTLVKSLYYCIIDTLRYLLQYSSNIYEIGGYLFPSGKAA